MRARFHGERAPAASADGPRSPVAAPARPDSAVVAHAGGAHRWDRTLLWALSLFLALTVAGCQAHAVWWLMQ